MIASIGSMSTLVGTHKEMLHDLDTDTREGAVALGETLESIKNAYDRVGGIQEVIETINGVMSHTDLLAMNAAIEAAHDGDSGRGFAIVADEIRRLAEQTGENSTQVSADILAIADEIKHTREISMRTGARMDHIVSELSRISESFEELSVAMRQMNIGTVEIQTALERMLDSGQMLKSSADRVAETLRMATDFYDSLRALSDENIRVF
jgi:methyl-accepting chemotaxis protein